MKGKKVGLVLGSGSSRGWAHIGVLEALVEGGIDIGMICGVSAGAVIAVSYAGGGLDNIKKFALDMDWGRVLSYLDIAFPRSGFIEGKKVIELVQQYTDVTSFDDLDIPVQMVTTDMYTGEQVTLSEGSLIQAMRASMAVPGLLAPIQIQGRWLVDGAVVNPLPVDVCRSMGADLVIAVDLNSERISKDYTKNPGPEWQKNTAGIEKKRLEVVKSWVEKYGSTGKTVSSKIDHWFSREAASPHIFEVLSSSLNIMQRKIELMNLETHPPDILIKPRLGNMKFFDFDHAESAIEEGYCRGRAALPSILDHMKATST